MSRLVTCLPGCIIAGMIKVKLSNDHSGECNELELHRRLTKKQQSMLGRTGFTDHAHKILYSHCQLLADFTCRIVFEVYFQKTTQPKQTAKGVR